MDVIEKMSASELGGDEPLEKKRRTGLSEDGSITHPPATTVEPSLRFILPTVEAMDEPVMDCNSQAAIATTPPAESIVDTSNVSPLQIFQNFLKENCVGSEFKELDLRDECITPARHAQILAMFDAFRFAENKHERDDAWAALNQRTALQDATAIMKAAIFELSTRLELGGSTDVEQDKRSMNKMSTVIDSLSQHLQNSVRLEQPSVPLAQSPQPAVSTELAIAQATTSNRAAPTYLNDVPTAIRIARTVIQILIDESTQSIPSYRSSFWSQPDTLFIEQNVVSLKQPSVQQSCLRIIQNWIDGINEIVAEQQNRTAVRLVVLTQAERISAAAVTLQTAAGQIVRDLSEWGTKRPALERSGRRLLVSIEHSAHNLYQAVKYRVTHGPMGHLYDHSISSALPSQPDTSVSPKSPLNSRADRQSSTPQLGHWEKRISSEGTLRCQICPTSPSSDASKYAKTVP